MKTAILAIFFLIVGFVFLIRPREMRDWAIRSYDKLGIALPKSMQKFMQKFMASENYILSYKIGGAVSMVIGVFLALFILCN
jgi:hypothetical protein